MSNSNNLSTRMHRLVEEDEELFFHIYDQGKKAQETDGQKFAALNSGLSVILGESGLYMAYHIVVWIWRLM